MIFDQYDRIVVVNLRHRTDRRKRMKAELAKIGLKDDERVSFFPAIQTVDKGMFLRPGSHGCFLSHRSIIEDAAREGQSVAILQDDCQFLPAIVDFPATECDVFYGGYEASDPDDLHGSNIIGAHFMGFSTEAALKASHYLHRYLGCPNFEGDPQAVAHCRYDSKIRPPIDGAFVWFRRAHPELTTEFAMLSKQRSSRSDVADRKWFDRMHIVRDAARIWRDIRNR